MLPLPTNGQPKHFTGAVGNTNERHQNPIALMPDPMELRISLTGKGTLDNTPVRAMRGKDSNTSGHQRRIH